jgi:hypothetical protein
VRGVAYRFEQLAIASYVPVAGLDPATHALSREAVVQIVPIGILFEDQLNLPGAPPMLDIPLALLCPEDIVVPLGINETVQAVLFRETVGYAVSVLPGTSGRFVVVPT